MRFMIEVDTIDDPALPVHYLLGDGHRIARLVVQDGICTAAEHTAGPAWLHRSRVVHIAQDALDAGPAGVEVDGPAPSRRALLVAVMNGRLHRLGLPPIAR